MNKKLEDLDDEELNVAVALHVAGIKYRKERRAIWAETGCHAFMTEESEEVLVPERVPYATSADAVLPLLEKCDAWSKGTTGGAVTVYKLTLSPAKKPSDDIPDAEWMMLKPVGHYWNCQNPKPFPYSACIALLRANGIEEITT